MRALSVSPAPLLPSRPHSPPLSLSLLFLLTISLLSPAVRSESTTDGFSSVIIRLPTEGGGGGGGDDDLCASARSPSAASSCPVSCFRPDPVCGADGVTYWCGCADAACSGVSVAKLGFCEVGNGGDGLLSGQALLLVHIVWLIVLGFSVLFGLF